LAPYAGILPRLSSYSFDCCDDKLGLDGIDDVVVDVVNDVSAGLLVELALLKRDGPNRMS
jgi:hypothetical protein